MTTNSALIMLTPTEAHTSVGRWFRVLLPCGCRIVGRVASVSPDGNTIITADCPLSHIDIRDVAVWVENDTVIALVNTMAGGVKNGNGLCAEQ